MQKTCLSHCHYLPSFLFFAIIGFTHICSKWIQIDSSKLSILKAPWYILYIIIHTSIDSNIVWPRQKDIIVGTEKPEEIGILAWMRTWCGNFISFSIGFSIFTLLYCGEYGFRSLFENSLKEMPLSVGCSALRHVICFHLGERARTFHNFHNSIQMLIHWINSVNYRSESFYYKRNVEPENF